MTATATPAASNTPGRFFDCAFVYALCGTIQAVVLWSVFSGGINLGFALAYHGLVTALGFLALWFLARPLQTHHCFALVLIALGGPLGALLALFFSYRFNGIQPEASPELLAWYDTLAGRGTEFSPRLAGTDADGDEAFDVLDPDAPSLAEVVENGTLAQKRNAIARMAAAYHRDYHPLLKAALGDPEPTIRVQAAAILTGLAQEQRDRLDVCIETIPDADTAQLLKLSDTVTHLITSCLLDAEGLRLASRAMAPIVDTVVTAGSAGEIARLRMQLVWAAQSVDGDQGYVLRALLQKLVDHRPREGSR